MSDLGFVNKYLDNTNLFYSIALKQFKVYKKLLGTKVVVTRILNDSKYKSVFGSTYHSTLRNDNEVKKFDATIIINMNDMKRIFQKTIDQLDFYDNERVMELGDIFIFSRKNQEYKFKVVNIESFSEASDVLWRYTATGLVEVNQL
jgi:hypothetical protein